MDVNILDRTILAADRTANHKCNPSPYHPQSGIHESPIGASCRSNHISSRIVKNFSTPILCILAIAFFTAAFWPAFSKLWNVWINSEDYSHAPIMIPIIFYMVWAARSKLAQGTDKYALPGLTLTVASTALYLFALLTQVQTFIFVSTYLTLIGVVIYLAGAGAVKTLATPLLILLLLIPIPQQLYPQLTFPLQLKVSQASEFIVLLLDVPLFREGNVMHLPQKSFEVVEACSGLRSVFILLSLSIVMGYFLLRRWTSKSILFAAAIPIAVFVNIIRILSMILLFHFFNVDLSEGILHTTTGIMVLLLAILILFILQKVLSRCETKSI